MDWDKSERSRKRVALWAKVRSSGSEVSRLLNTIARVLPLPRFECGQAKEKHILNFRVEGQTDCD